MKQRFGALLCLVLGTVLIVTGLAAGSDGSVGGIAPPAVCGAEQVGISVPSCPTGTITITEQTTQEESGFADLAALAPTAPADWTVHITSTCLDPATNAPVDTDVTVPNNASMSSIDLYVYSVPNTATPCSYQLAEEPVAGFTASFDPPSPVTIPANGQRTGSNLDVALSNTFAADPTSSAPASSSPASSSVPASSSAAESAEPTVIAEPSESSSSAAALADTGPSSTVNASLWIGIALCLLGLVLLFEGRVRRIGRHRG